MGKKGGSKAQKKAEAEAAALQAALEEAERLEAERLKIEEEERKAREAEDAKLKAEEEERLAAEAEQLAAEAAEHAPFHAERKKAIDKFTAKDKAAREWERFVGCTHRPDPQFEKEVNGYESTVMEGESELLEPALNTVQDNEHIVLEANRYRIQALAAEEYETAKALKEYQDRIRVLSDAVLDRSTANILQTADEYANSKGEVQVSDSRKDFKYALWVNHAKNPRFKLIEVPALELTAELPKSLALASIAVRLVHRTYDNFTEHTKNEFMAVGGVFTVDLLSLPPPPKKVKGWTLRTVTPLAFDVNCLPYPIPPAGADPATLNPGQAAAPPPMVLTYKLPPELVLVDPEPMVGWWDKEAQEWKTDGITEIKVEEDTLTYATTKLTHLSLLQSRVALLPYKHWNMRPSESGETCIISLTPAMAEFDSPFEIEAGDGWCRFMSPHFPQLERAGLYEPQVSPWDLLTKLSECGIHLMPEDRDCVFVDLEKKEYELERLFCADLALLAPAFMLASSKWNRDLGKDDCMVRISEVTDYDRTLAVDLDKVFTREKETVHVILRKVKGCAFVDAKDNLEALSKELEVHMADGRDNIGAAAVRSRNETFEQPLEPMKYNQTVLSLLKGVASEEGLDRVHMASPPFTECVKNLLILLRVFTFG